MSHSSFHSETCRPSTFLSRTSSRRQLVPDLALAEAKTHSLACIVLFLFLLLFSAELWAPTDVKRLQATSPSFVINTDVPTPTTLSTSSITSADNIYNQEESVVFSLIIWSEQSAVEGALLIKVSLWPSCRTA